MKRVAAGLFVGLLIAACGTVAPATTAPSRPPSATVAPSGTTTSAPPPSTAVVPTPSVRASVSGLPYDELLAHIPPIAGGCVERSLFTTGAIAITTCMEVQAPGGGEASVNYFLFDELSTADAYFDRELSRGMGDPAGSDCHIGPSAYPHQVGGEVIGRVLCAGDPAVGLRVVWTDSRSIAGRTGAGSLGLGPGTYADLGALFDAAQFVP